MCLSDPLGFGRGFDMMKIKQPPACFNGATVLIVSISPFSSFIPFGSRNDPPLSSLLSNKLLSLISGN